MPLVACRIASAAASFVAAIALMTAATVGAAAEPGAAGRACADCALLAESAPKYPKRRYSKRAARKAWLEHKRIAGKKGRRDLQRKPGSNEGWVTRLRRAQKKHAERVARAKARKARKKQAKDTATAGKSRRKGARVYVFEKRAGSDRKRGGDWNAKDKAKPEGRTSPKRNDGDDKDDGFKPNWNDREKKSGD